VAFPRCDRAAAREPRLRQSGHRTSAQLHPAPPTVILALRAGRACDDAAAPCQAHTSAGMVRLGVALSTGGEGRRHHAPLGLRSPASLALCLLTPLMRSEANPRCLLRGCPCSGHLQQAATMCHVPCAARMAALPRYVLELMALGAWAWSAPRSVSRNCGGRGMAF
jgi:hypothetical protein